MKKEVVHQLVKEALGENNSLFLIDLTLHQDNKIVVQIDGEHGVPLQECIRISRYVEQSLDREIEDYALEVTTPDITEPLKDIRQYQKNMERTLKVFLKEGNSIEGILKKITEKNIELECKIREPKPIGKGKVTVIKKIEIPFSTIEKAIVKIIF